jgi:hypothetical protein
MDWATFWATFSQTHLGTLITYCPQESRESVVVPDTEEDGDGGDEVDEVSDLLRDRGVA